MRLSIFLELGLHHSLVFAVANDVQNPGSFYKHRVCWLVCVQNYLYAYWCV